MLIKEAFSLPLRLKIINLNTKTAMCAYNHSYLIISYCLCGYTAHINFILNNKN